MRADHRRYRAGRQLPDGVAARQGLRGARLIRRASTFKTDRIDEYYQDPHGPERKLILHYQTTKLILHYGDLSDGTGLVNLLGSSKPDEVYHLGAQSHVKVSFESRSTPVTSRVSGPCDCSRCSGRPT